MLKGCKISLPAGGSCFLGSSFAGGGFGTTGASLFSAGGGDAASGGLKEEAPGLKLKEAAAGFILKDDGLLSARGAGGGVSA